MSVLIESMNSRDIIRLYHPGQTFLHLDPSYGFGTLKSVSESDARLAVRLFRGIVD